MGISAKIGQMTSSKVLYVYLITLSVKGFASKGLWDKSIDRNTFYQKTAKNWIVMILPVQIYCFGRHVWFSS